MFEMFKGRYQYKGNQVGNLTPCVSFCKNGMMYFNKAATKEFRKEAISTVLLFWDKEARLVGIQKCYDDKKDIYYKLRYDTKNAVGSKFSAISFLKYIEFDRSKKKVFPIHWDDEEKMFIFEVAQEGR